MTTSESHMMKRSEVVALVGICYTTIYNLEKNGKFPSRRRISHGRVGWLRSEVMTWLDNRVPVRALEA